jgi:hypothetical protein
MSLATQRSLLGRHSLLHQICTQLKQKLAPWRTVDADVNEERGNIQSILIEMDITDSIQAKEMA